MLNTIIEKPQMKATTQSVLYSNRHHRIRPLLVQSMAGYTSTAASRQPCKGKGMPIPTTGAVTLYITPWPALINSISTFHTETEVHRNLPQPG